MNETKPNPFKLWGNFLIHDKLSPVKMPSTDLLKYLSLVNTLVEKNPLDKYPHDFNRRQSCRKQVCNTAMDLDIDLMAFKDYKGKVLIGRGLIDMWMIAYTERFGSTLGTNGEKELIRRKIVTKLSKESK